MTPYSGDLSEVLRNTDIGDPPFPKEQADVSSCNSQPVFCNTSSGGVHVAGLPANPSHHGEKGTSSIHGILNPEETKEGSNSNCKSMDEQRRQSEHDYQNFAGQLRQLQADIKEIKWHVQSMTRDQVRQAAQLANINLTMHRIETQIALIVQSDREKREATKTIPGFKEALGPPR